jgi:polyisoprenoid-binding protein YceI
MQMIPQNPLKKLLAAAAFCFCSLLVNAQTKQWEFEPSHCKVRFSVAHFGISETEGEFHTFQGSIAPNGDDFANASVTFNLEASSLDTNDDQRDNHLKSADFFDVAKYPTLLFQGKLVKVRGDKSAYQLVGNFTMHGVTKPLTLAVRFGGIVPKDPFGNTKAGFKATGTLNRKDWGLIWNKALDSGGVAIGDEVELVANIELIKK